jgi:deoxyribodipyrimidine photolyase
MANQSLLEKLALPGALAHRILIRSPIHERFNEKLTDTSFVLYLPTVVLRKRHNPAFALACRIANEYKVPLVVLCTVLDDHHLTRQPEKPVCMTARRLAFTLEALQSCSHDWEAHGAGVAIRVHGPASRIPHHLTLAHQALAVVMDEPFVEPFRTYMRKVVLSCRTAGVPCFTVDGSTTVPPNSRLRKSDVNTFPGDISFVGVPSKAWKWEQETQVGRKAEVFRILKDNHLDAPSLCVKLPNNFFLVDHGSVSEAAVSILRKMPSKWTDSTTPCPGTRPWTVEELSAIKDLKRWTMTSWPGTDTSVPPCQQTHGSNEAATQRWKAFVQHGLNSYARRRNQIALPHAVSRVSCYLNLGILSIMDVVADVWQASSDRKGTEGCKKYLEECIKWREIGYVHTFALPGYHTVEVIPSWSLSFLQKQLHTGGGEGHTFEVLDTATTGDEIWDAMQSYLIDTGELHNNARMTWGKTVVHWQASIAPPEDIIRHLITLNDRYALDGLSPPSYAGILWCFGWGDKPGPSGSISTKWARHYRQGSESFEIAKDRLYSDGITTTVDTSVVTQTAFTQPTKKARHEVVAAKSRITSYFTPAAKATN